MKIYGLKNLDLKSAISLPGLSIQYLFKLKDKSAPIFMFGEQYKELFSLIRQNVRGGLSMVYSRYQECDITKIKPEYFGELAKTTKSCIGYDATSLYLSCLMKDMPTGFFIRRRCESNFVIEKSYKYGQKALEWISWMEIKLNVVCQHMFNGKEKRIGGRQIPVDGYATTHNGQKLVFNYSGCYYHSHLCPSQPEGKYKNKLKDIENRLKTIQTLEYFKSLGYTVYHIWECQFDKLKREDYKIKQFCNNLDFVVDTRYQISEKQIVNEIQSGKIFGMAEVDIITPESLKSIFAEYQPIQKHAFLSRDCIGQHMKDFAEKNGLLKRPMKTLLSSYHAKKILLATPLLQWLINHGLICTKVYQIIQYKPTKCFKRFGDEVTEARRLGDKDSSKKMISDSSKLMGNSAYGRTLLDIESHLNVTFHHSDKGDVSQLVNDRHFRQLEELGDDLVEIQSAKQLLKFNVPIQIGFMVLNYAKLALLKFYYDFLLKYLPLDGFCLIQADTDSLYLALSEKSLYETVKPSMRNQFVNEYESWMAKEYCETHKNQFFECVFAGKVWKSEDCCQQSAHYHKRTPGLFHCEINARGVVALCSKSYYCFGEEDKISSKGISKKYTKYTKRDYLNTLRQQTILEGTNKGFRLKENKMLTCIQHKKGLNYFYGTRIVLKDGVTTLPTEL